MTKSKTVLVCPKCGGKDIHTAYHNRQADWHRGCAWNAFEESETEHLHRFCRGCSFDWINPIITPTKKGRK